MTLIRLMLTAMVLSAALTACGVRGDTKPLDTPAEQSQQ